jgi:hypothetical protein
MLCLLDHQYRQYILNLVSLPNHEIEFYVSITFFTWMFDDNK